MLLLRSILRVLPFAILLLPSGCVLEPPAASTSITLAGHIHGGQQPVAGAMIQLYAIVGQSTVGIMNPTTSDSHGSFSLTGLYNCPFPSSEVYLVAMGGDPGLGTINPSLGMMTALGPCGNLTSSTFIWISELTTVASVEALSTYMFAYNVMSPQYGDPTQFTTHFTQVNQYIDTATGTAPGPALSAGSSFSIATLNTLADILAACINSTGGTAGDGSVCGNLFTLSNHAGPGNANTPTDTLSAIIQIAHYPTVNVTALFNLAAAASPFQPLLPSPPASFSLPIQTGP